MADSTPSDPCTLGESTVFRGSRLARADFAEFLLQAYLGGDGRFESAGGLGRYVYRAYLDVCRTLHGFGQCEGKSDRLVECIDWMAAQVSLIAHDKTVSDSQSSFDTWHSITRAGMVSRIGVWDSEHSLMVGQSQKWLNMTLKYLFVAIALGVSEEFRGVAAGYQHSHLPLDGVVLGRLAAEGCTVAEPWRVGWSRMDEVTYLQIQEWSRANLVTGGSLLDLDFELWDKRRRA